MYNNQIPRECNTRDEERRKQTETHGNNKASIGAGIGGYILSRDGRRKEKEKQKENESMHERCIYKQQRPF